MESSSASQRLRLAELTSSVGAGVLGFGLGLLVPRAISLGGLPVLLVGLGLHAWGMFDKHRLQSGQIETWWSKAAYWICWVLIAVLVVVLVARGLSR